MENNCKKKVFGARLQIVRENHGWTKQALGNIVGVSDVTIGYFEHGKKWPSVPTLMTLAQVLEVSTDYLLGLTDQGPSGNPEHTETR